MYINSVLSFLGAWKKLQQNHRPELDEITQVLESLDEKDFLNKIPRQHSRRELLLSLPAIAKAFEKRLEEKGWDRNVKIRPGSGTRSQVFMIDAAKNGVVVDLRMGKRAFVESLLFVILPFFIRVQSLEVGIVLVPMYSLRSKMPMGVSDFESIRDLLVELDPMPLKYPFVIVGFSTEQMPLDVTELASDLDIFLIENIGYSLEEMSLLGESPNYDFKEQLPTNKKLSQEACAFANLSGGGVILLGVDDSGNASGIPRGTELDEIQLKITNVIHSSCLPVPQFEFHAFDAPEDSSRCILAVRVNELEPKPCMTQDKVYVRSGPSARPASPSEIRQLILG